MQVNNTIPELYPAFNRSLIELESFNYLKEKHNYIMDVLSDETVHSLALDSYFWGYPGALALGGGIGTSNYTPGDYVHVRNITGPTDYTGIYKVIAVPNDQVVILDTPFINQFTGAQVRVYRIYRQKLPANPQGKAVFNVNGYATGIVRHDFGLNNVGAFNVPNSYDRLLVLPSEEYYQNFTYQTVQNNGGLAEFTGLSGDLFVGQTIEIIADNYLITLYNGLAQVVAINGNDVTINKAFAGAVISTGQIITLPKIPVWYKDYNDLSTEKIIFNGALPYPEILSFDADDYDVSLIGQPAEFLTTLPNTTQKIKLDQRAYTQFYQSINTTATQFAVDVVDELGVTHQYIVDFASAPDNVIGLAIGPYDLAQIDPALITVPPGRSLPIVDECDASYCVYLWGENTCNIQGVQNVKFVHPYIAVTNGITWSQQQATSYEIEVTTLEIGGLPQPITPTGNTYNQGAVLGQSEEEIYSDEIGLQTALTIQSTQQAGGLGFLDGHNIDIDFAQDFLLEVDVKLNSNFYGGGSIVKVSYKWDVASCSAEYKILNGKVKVGKVGPTTVYYTQYLSGFVGLQSTLIAPDSLTEKICFDLDYTPYAYSGARVLFQDRLGSFIGYNFNLKRARRITTASDGYEKDVISIEPGDSITRGFETIQNSYSEEWDLLTDYISELDAKYLEECYTSANIFVQFKGEVYPAIIKPKTQVGQEKENTALRQVGITLRINRTQYSQRN